MEWSRESLMQMRAVLIATGRPWVARNYHGHLWAHREKPTKDQLTWITWITCTNCCELDATILPEIKWEDAQPVNIEAVLGIGGQDAVRQLEDAVWAFSGKTLGGGYVGNVRGLRM